MQKYSEFVKKELETDKADDVPRIFACKVMLPKCMETMKSFRPSAGFTLDKASEYPCLLKKGQKR